MGLRLNLIASLQPRPSDLSDTCSVVVLPTYGDDDMPSTTELRQSITNRIVEALESGNLPPWRRPWIRHKNAGLPTNVLSKRRYSGVNPILLQLASMRHGLTSKFWGTFNQWKSLGLKVMQRPKRVPSGQWGTTVIFYKPCTKVELDQDTGEEEEIKFGVLKSYCVFNADQVEGENIGKYRIGEVTASPQFDDFEPAEEAITATGAEIHFGGDRAFYVRPTPNGDGDYIQVPHKSHFIERKEYYATMLHELTHWSECRLNWTGSYAEGELRAEIAASFLVAELGIQQSDDLSNHHAYLASWIKALRNDPRFIFRASTQASKAVDYLLSFSRQEADQPLIVV